LLGVQFSFWPVRSLIRPSPNLLHQRLRALPLLAGHAPVTSGWSSSCRVGYLPPTGKARSFHGALGIWVKLILAVADDEWKSLIKFGVHTSQRLADIALLRWEQIDFEHDEIRFIVRKTGKKLVVPIAAPLREHLLTLPGHTKRMEKC
jgi:hypothetical protein